MFKYFLVSLFLVNTLYAAVVTKLADYLVGSGATGVIEILGKQGIKGSDALEVQHYLESSIKSLGVKNFTKEEFTKVLNKLPVTGDEVSMRTKLYQLLDKPADKVTKEEIVDAVNKIVRLARGHGKSVVITCANCANEKLAGLGFEFTVKEIKNASMRDLMEKVIPKNPNELNKFIGSRMRSSGLGDYSKVTPGLVLPEEERAMAAFVEMATNERTTTTGQKAFIKAVKNISTDQSGKTNLINPKNPHKFWKVLAEASADDEAAASAKGLSMKQWASLLDEVATRSRKDGVNTEEAFYRVLKDKPGADDNLLKQLKSKRCFFR